MITTVPTAEAKAETQGEVSNRPIWEIVAELGDQIPVAERTGVPHDGSINYKYYLYGEKKEDL